MLLESNEAKWFVEGTCVHDTNVFSYRPKRSQMISVFVLEIVLIAQTFISHHLAAARCEVQTEAVYLLSLPSYGV